MKIWNKPEIEEIEVAMTMEKRAGGVEKSGGSDADKYYSAS